MLLEMHCHTSEHSPCSYVGAVDLVRRVYARGLEGVVFTDHQYLWTPQEIEEVRRGAGAPDYFVLLSGQEVATADSGHVVVYGADKSLASGTPLEEIRAAYPGAALVLAHPFRKNKRPEKEKLLNPLLDAVEIFSTNHSVVEKSRALKAWHAYKFTAIGGTDAHAASSAGLYPTLFDHPVNTIEELVEELRNGRCRPFYKEIPRAGTHVRVSEITIGTKGADESRERIIIRSLPSEQKWRSAERAYEIMRVISEHGFAGGRYRVPKPIDRDAETLTFIEQGLRGKTLFEKVIAADVESARYFVELAAQWLARLHACNLQITPPEEFLQKEEKRLARYLERFESAEHPHTRRVRELVEEVSGAEKSLYKGRPDLLIQGHGDFHPKNVYIGQDNLDKRDTLYVAAIDFESSMCMPQAFDVGTFLAQFRNQLSSYPDILRSVPDEIFLDVYLDAAGGTGLGFLRQVELFHARANLSIAAFLVKMGLGDSENLWRVLVEAERAMANYMA